MHISNHTENGKPRGTLIYVVDDEPMLLELATAILEPCGYRVRNFRDPQLALEAFAAARPRPDLIITDYAMHGLDGLLLTESCRRIEPAQRVLLVSGTVGPEVLTNAPSKPDRFLAKPYNVDQLIAMVEEVLQD
jgi:CheY-like chemotaxis protein